MSGAGWKWLNLKCSFYQGVILRDFSPKDLACISAIAGLVDIRLAVMASHAQHDAIAGGPKVTSSAHYLPGFSVGNMNAALSSLPARVGRSAYISRLHYDVSTLPRFIDIAIPPE